MTELVGFKELTPYRGGWCGNEIFSTAFTPKVRNKARELTFKFEANPPPEEAVVKKIDEE